MAESLPQSLPVPWLIVAVVGYGIVLAYALLILQQILLGLLVGVWLGILYVCWRFLVAIEAIAAAHQRIANELDGD